MIGLGRVAVESMIPAVRKSRNAELYAAASRDIRRAESVRPTNRAYDDYSQMFADPNIDAVYIATHNGLHCNLVLEALRNGKHVLCEKPLGLNAEECEAMATAATNADRLLVEAFMYRYHPQLRRAKALIAAGKIGKVVSVATAFHFRMRKADDVRLHREWGGGALLDVGCYCANAIRFFLGNTPTQTNAVAEFDPAHDIDTQVSAVLRYEGDCSATISCGFRCGLYQDLVVMGSDGILRISEPFIDWTGESIVALLAGRQVESFSFRNVDRFVLEVEDFADAIINRSRPMLRPEEGLLNARLLDEIARSMRAGTV